jgi:hypothetical protein
MTQKLTLFRCFIFKMKTVPQKIINDNTSTNKNLEKSLDGFNKPEPKTEEPKEQIQEEFSLLSTLTSSSVMDVTVAASEKVKMAPLIPQITP